MAPAPETQGPPEATGDPLAVALLPVLLHRINNVTQLLTSLNSVLVLSAADEQGTPGPEGLHGQMLLDAARDSEELGWLLGVLGCGMGADLLLERREPRGLDATVRLVAQALRRARADLILEPAEAWPSLTNQVPSHGDLCWVVAYGLWFAAREGGWLRLEEAAGDGTHILACSGASTADWSPVRAALAQRLPGAVFESSETGWSLRLLAGWLTSEA